MKFRNLYLQLINEVNAVDDGMSYRSVLNKLCFQIH